MMQQIRGHGSEAMRHVRYAFEAWLTDAEARIALPTLAHRAAVWSSPWPAAHFPAMPKRTDPWILTFFCGRSHVRAYNPFSLMTRLSVALMIIYLGQVESSGLVGFVSRGSPQDRPHMLYSHRLPYDSMDDIWFIRRKRHEASQSNA